MTPPRKEPTMLHVSEITVDLGDEHVCVDGCSRYLSGRTAGRRNETEDASVHARAILHAHPCWVRGYTDGTHGLDAFDEE